MEKEAVTVEELNRIFSVRRSVFKQETVVALNGVSFTVKEGETFALLGQNGAGKTTLFKVLATLLSPTSGSVSVAEHRLPTQVQAARRSIGVTFGGERGFFGRLTAWENLMYAACLYDLPMHSWRGLIASTLTLVDLIDVCHRPVGTFSRGMRQRLHIARALLHDPPILILDEPTSGLDPEAAMRIRRLIRRLSGSGKTILFSTHQMIEAEQLADRVALLARGELLKVAPPHEYLQEMRCDFIIDITRITDPDTIRDKYTGLAGAVGYFLELVDTAWQAKILVKGAPPDPSVVAAGLGLHPGARVSVRIPSLEDVYLKMIEDLQQGEKVG